jgi:hypothetical protein
MKMNFALQPNGHCQPFSELDNQTMISVWGFESPLGIPSPNHVCILGFREGKWPRTWLAPRSKPEVKIKTVGTEIISNRTGTSVYNTITATVFDTTTNSNQLDISEKFQLLLFMISLKKIRHRSSN